MSEPANGETVVETERLKLRRMDEHDAEFILGLLNEPSFIQYIGDRGVRTVEAARKYIAAGAMASYARFGFGLYLVTERHTGAPMGMCGLLKRDTLEDVDIGFAFVPAYWSSGYAIEAALAVIDYGSRVFGLKRIVAITNPDNERSIRLLGKLGFVFERVTRLGPDAPEVKLFGLTLQPR